MPARLGYRMRQKTEKKKRKRTESRHWGPCTDIKHDVERS